MRDNLPSGTVTFLFTDVEGSTTLLHELGAEAYADALAEHRRLIREACYAHGGVEVDTQGDAFFFAFPTAPGALAAASSLTEALASGPIRVRVGLHTGTPLVVKEGYVGADVHRASRIAAAGHGGQVLVSAATAQLVEVELRDLGEHRLKDLSAPERVFQLGDADFPPLKSLHQTNLPVPQTPFLGRQKELGEVVDLLSRDDVRLLTLTGPGGIGKTRLAAQAAGALAEHYPHGVFWVPLASLRDPKFVLQSAAQVLGAKDVLSSYIADQQMLLLFDNFEHVVEAASDLSLLLGACPYLELLVTSREPLHLAGEQEYRVPPFVHEEAIGFFAYRARSAKPYFELDDAVPEICLRLDSLPLALELAAARVKALSTQQILSRLETRLPLLTTSRRDAPERQRTLRATIEWSYDLLSSEEQQLFARLSVFAGGCTLEAAEGVAQADLDTLQSLVDKSLLRHVEDRFWMLETIREFALERLDESEEAAEDLRRRHAEHFLALAEEAEPHVFGGGSAEWLELLEREHNNLRAALDRYESSGETQLALRLAGALRDFWSLRGYYLEGHRRFESALRADERPTSARAKALNGAADLAMGRGHVATARLQAEEALSLHHRLEDTSGAAYSRLVLGHAAADEGDLAKAQELFERSVGDFREVGDQHYVLLATRSLAETCYSLGDRKRGRALHEDNLRRARALANKNIEAESLARLASDAIHRGQAEDALSMATESLRIELDLGNRQGIAIALYRCAGALALKGRARTATRLVSSSEAVYEELGARVRPWLAQENEETLASIRSQLDDAAFDAAWKEGRTLSIDEAVALALGEKGLRA